MQQTNQGKSGGNIGGKPHSKGGTKAVVVDDNRRPIEVESGEVIINKDAVKKYWKELNRINTSTGGKPIRNPATIHAKLGGKIIKSQHVNSIIFSIRKFDKQQVFEWLKKNKFSPKETDVLEHMTVYEFLNNSKKPIDKKTKQIVNIENGVRAICFNFKK